jgi:hypothetical protein
MSTAFKANLRASIIQLDPNSMGPVTGANLHEISTNINSLSSSVHTFLIFNNSSSQWQPQPPGSGVPDITSVASVLTIPLEI